MSFIQVVTTTDTKGRAQAIARCLVEQKLAACVQVTGVIESTYPWKGKIERSREYLCLIKTREDLFPEVESAIRKLHPYETPEIIAVPIIRGNQAYLKWMEDSLAEKP